MKIILEELVMVKHRLRVKHTSALSCWEGFIESEGNKEEGGDRNTSESVGSC